MDKPYAIYKKVKIYRNREMIPGSNLRELKDGIMKECKPQYYPAQYAHMDGYPCDTLREAKQTIDRIESECRRNGCFDRKTFTEVMNNGC